MHTRILGIDAGGTFTDFVLLSATGEEVSLRTHKVLSTPASPELAILQGIRELGLEATVERGTLHIIHGSTVATNAALESKGVRTAFISNYGFADMLTLARQTRPGLYQLDSPPLVPPVPREFCLETGGRLSASVEVLEPLTEQELTTLVNRLRELRPQAVAINLLFSFLDDRFERRIEEALGDCDAFVCRSSSVLPEYREYERGIATWLNASLGPVVGGYLQRLRRQLGRCPLQIMQSSGETFAAETAARRAVNLLLSGPAAGLCAIQHLGQRLQEPRLMSFDMGGTSTDVALLDGDLRITSEGRVAGYPVAVPMVDMHTIGAGGGSLACLDPGGMLQVGPQSAGADPGPACYGRGGEQATVTDANLVLGRLQLDPAGASHLTLDRGCAMRAMEKLANAMGMDVMQTARGVIEVANTHMVNALRLISVQKGYDPREFRLACFGGAGGLHVCALADAMGMRRAVVPTHAGVLSALGMLVAPRGRQFSRSVRLVLDQVPGAEIDALFATLMAQGGSELESEGLSRQNLQAELSADVCYRGQSFALNIPWQDSAQLERDFQRRHLERYGFQHDSVIELVNLRVKLSSAAGIPELPGPALALAASTEGEAEVFGYPDAVRVLRRGSLEAGSHIAGPAIITEFSSTTFIPADWSAEIDKLGNILLAAG